MKDKELKKLIYEAYRLPESEKSKSFIRTQSRRSCSIPEIAINELKYAGIKGPVVVLLLCVVFAFASRIEDENIVWAMMSSIPPSALIPLFFISKSQRYGMAELEDACRFSARFIRMVRMGILGLFSLGMILVSALIFGSSIMIEPMEIVMYILIPYCLSIWMGMVITRKIHGSESIYAVFAAGILSSFIPTLIKGLQNLKCIPSFVYPAVFMLVLLLVFSECTRYVNERSEFEWN